MAPEYTYPNNEAIPQWARGKTAADILALTQGLIESVNRPQAPPTPAPAPLPTDDEFITAGQLRQHVNSAQQAALNSISPYLRTVADQQATVSYSIAKSKEPEMFKKYEPEIATVLNRIPRENWTLDAIQNAITFVKGIHHDELVAEKARQLEANLDSAMRSTGRAGLNSASPPTESVAAGLAKVPEAWRARAKAVGITEDQVREFCWANDTTPDEFFKQFGSGLVSDAVAEMNFGGKLTA